MTREEQIEDAADAFSRAKIASGNINFIKEECFRQGAEWADANRWISVEDELPPDGNCLVAYRFGVAESKFVFGRFILSRGDFTKVPEVTHWMPLPEPPKI